MTIEYKVNHPITAREFIDLLKQTTLGVRRPIENIVAIQAMLDHANLTVTAWQGDELVGISRSVTDFYFCCYLSDLAVSENIQAKGIGKELIKRTFLQLNSGCKLNLLAAPQAVDYYPHIGLERHDSAWILSDLKQLD
ncbi:GNAT family N-acetyltransferase [Vibrio sp. S17_S38]|uniref:GNAT family N-acetyltransferase n=1 Tax=Vibrio sp. S17_S38 TaxID=2720229 RepID=UPI00168080D1|nr:GNAT family N-acetyltransferase [Vibrio sp. S17_S38]MBD1573497.1 GNAT family N-acetyltransferase [Vibrio sp. S17_S38]